MSLTVILFLQLPLRRFDYQTLRIDMRCFQWILVMEYIEVVNVQGLRRRGVGPVHPHTQNQIDTLNVLYH